MIDTQAKQAPYFKLLALDHQGTWLIWEQASSALSIDPRLFTLVVCTL